LDNTKYDKNRKAKAYLEASKIEAYYFTTLQPKSKSHGEALEVDQVTGVVKHLNYECFDDFKQAVFGFLRSLLGSILNRNSG
jgi:hypothetical protein